MDRKIMKMHKEDNLIIISFMVTLWCVLGYVILQISSFVEHTKIKYLICTIGVVALIFATTALVEVINHLWKKKTEIYTEEITVMESNKNHKSA